MANFTVGPFFPPHFVELGCNDLTCVGKNIAKGQNILLCGSVTDSDNEPAINVIVEIWQADANGIFRHPSDPRFAEADPGFFGWGRCFTDQQGQYCFLTVMPGTYTADNGWPRCPHIPHVARFRNYAPARHHRFLRRYSRNGGRSRPEMHRDLAARRRLFAIRDPTLDREKAQGFRFDIVLRGEHETPFFLD